MAELSLRRYEIRRVLGKGGTGTVYEAFDTKTRALVALKAVEASVAESLYRLKHEFRALSDVQHQNLVHFGELASEDGKWFFTMELVSGSTFSDYVRPADDDDEVTELPRPRRAEGSRDEDGEDVVTRTVLRVWAGGSGHEQERGTVAVVPPSGPALDPARLRSALAQLVEALSALHEAGHVHRDVKPSNVLVTREGRLVLLDFGLVTALAIGEHSMGGGDTAGTPAYMAPEQIEGTAIGPAADWYAVGVMLFHALTGSLPFSGLVGSVLEAKRERPAPAPHERMPDVPADLDALCVQLLERDPAKRPTEEQLRARLGLPPRDAAAAAASAAGEWSGPFVGRAREQAALATALTAVQTGKARVVLVEGEPGVGKSALVQQFLARLPARSVVLAGRCYEQENVPFKGVDSIIDALSAHLLVRRDEELGMLLAGGVRYLASVFPVLCRVPAILAASSERSVANQAGLREQAFGELSRLFAALSRDRLLVVFLDDLQWVDADSMALLERAVLPQSGANCLFVATLRSAIEVSKPVAQLRESGERLELRGLSDDESRALWNSLRRPDESRSAAQAEERSAAMREAAGHPLFLAELARAAEAGRFDSHAGALLDVLRDRISHHDAIERGFLEMAAVAGAPTPYEIIARAAQLDVGECLTRIGGLKAAQLLRVTLQGDERCIEPYHDRIREAIMEPLRGDGGRATLLQLRLGRALLEATADDSLRARIFTIVQHLNAARALLDAPGERLRVAELDLLASREARLATAYDRARDYARIGLELIGEQGWEHAFALCRDLHMARMEAEFLAGDLDGARAVFEAARPHLRTPGDTAALWAAWVVLETGRARFREAISAGRDGMRALGVPMPEHFTRAVVLRQYAETRWAQLRRPVHSLDDLPLLDDARLKGALQLLLAIGPAAFFVDTNLLTWINMRIAAQSMRHGISDVTSFGFAGYGMVLAGAFGKHKEAAEFGQLALRFNERFQNPRLAAKLHVITGGFITHWVRPFAESKALLRTAHQLGIKHGDAAYEVYAATILSVVSFCESAELSAVQGTGEWARDVGARRKIKDMAAVPEAHMRQAATLRGLTPSPLDLGLTAEATDAAFRATLDPKSTPVALFYYYFCNAELAYLAGQADHAEVLLAQAERHKEGIFAIPTTAELCFLRTLVAARRAAATTGLEHARLVVGLVEGVRQLSVWGRRSPENYEAQALIAKAELARVLGRHRLAAAEYRRAIGTARAHGSVKREALALELAALHTAAQGDAAGAERLRREAIDAYRRWGAVTKATALAVATL